MATEWIDGMLAGMPANVEDPLIDTWRPEPESWVLAVPFVAIAAAWFVFVGVGVIRAVQDRDLVGVCLWTLMCLGGLAILWEPIRYRTSRLEIRRAGLTVISLGRCRRVEWSDLARIEVDDVDFPRLRGRGPCLVLVLTDRRRVRVWVTEQSGWRYDDRAAALEDRADQLRAIRRKHQSIGS